MPKQTKFRTKKQRKAENKAKKARLEKENKLTTVGSIKDIDTAQIAAKKTAGTTGLVSLQNSGYKTGDHIEKVGETLLRVTDITGKVTYKSVTKNATQGKLPIGVKDTGTKSVYNNSTYSYGGTTYSVCNHWQNKLTIAGHDVLASGIMGGKGSGVWPDFGVYLDYKWADYLEIELVSFGSGVKGRKEHPVWLLPWRDYGSVDMRKFRQIIDEIGRQWKKGIKTLEIGCLGAHGRTGTVIAGLIVKYEGLGAAEAIEQTRKRHCDKCVETYAQKCMVYDLAGEERPKAPPAVTTSAGICGITKCKKPYNLCECSQAELLEAGEISEASYNTNIKNKEFTPKVTTNGFCAQCKAFVSNCSHKAATGKSKVLLTWCADCKDDIEDCAHKDNFGDVYCSDCFKFVVWCEHKPTGNKKNTEPIQTMIPNDLDDLALCPICKHEFDDCECIKNEGVNCIICENDYLGCYCDQESLSYKEWADKNIEAIQSLEAITCQTCHRHVGDCECDKDAEEYWWERECERCHRIAYSCTCGGPDRIAEPEQPDLEEDMSILTGGCALCGFTLENCICKEDLQKWCNDCGKFQFLCECHR